MRVRMTRTVRTASGALFVIGADYELPDSLADVWVGYGVCDRVDDVLPADPSDPGPVPPSEPEGPDTPDQRRVKEKKQ